MLCLEILVSKYLILVNIKLKKLSLTLDQT